MYRINVTKMTKTQEPLILPHVLVVLLNLVFWSCLSCSRNACLCLIWPLCWFCPALFTTEDDKELRRMAWSAGRCPRSGMGLFDATLSQGLGDQPVMLSALFMPNLFPASSQAERPAKGNDV